MGEKKQKIIKEAMQWGVWLSLPIVCILHWHFPQSLILVGWAIGVSAGALTAYGIVKQE